MHPTKTIINSSSMKWHMTLGLRIHFPYLSQPSVSKICSFTIQAFIRVHFGCFGKFSQHSPFRCIYIFFKTGVMISESFSKEKLEVISFQKRVGFSARQFYFSFSSFSFFFSSSIKLLLFVYFLFF